jgi:hypothetical protein
MSNWLNETLVGSGGGPMVVVGGWLKRELVVERERRGLSQLSGGVL